MIRFVYSHNRDAPPEFSVNVINERCEYTELVNIYHPWLSKYIVD
jgi:hypothetical protein